MYEDFINFDSVIFLDWSVFHSVVSWVYVIYWEVFLTWIFTFRA